MELLAEIDAIPADDEPAKLNWLQANFTSALAETSAKRNGRSVIFYASAFLQKPIAPAFATQLTHEELNGFMSVVYGMDCGSGLTLLLHTPGGVTNAAETIVAYLWSKFPDVEVIVPTFAMSAGTMISLATNRIIMGRQSQLGPIDPQLPLAGRAISARAIVDQFDAAKGEILADQATAHVWAPVLAQVGPALLQEAKNALAYGEEMVARWLQEHMFASEASAKAKAEGVARHFNDASVHKSHGRRIDRDEARSQGVAVLDLEDDQALQDSVLTAYHLATIVFERTPTAKLLMTNQGRSWVKNIAGSASK